MIFPTPYLLAGALAVGLLTGWTANGWRLNGKIDAMVLEHTQAVQVATEQAAAKTQQMQEEKDAALRKAVEIVPSPKLPTPPSLSTPAPSASYSSSAQKNIQSWQQKLTATPLTPKVSSQLGQPSRE
jgi:hypothetical protein